MPKGVGVFCFIFDLILWGSFFPGKLTAAPPLKQEFYKGGKTCYLNDIAAASQIQKRSEGGAGAQGLPNPPAPRIIVIRVQFSDLSMGLSKFQTESFFSKVRDFYSENSYGVFLPTFTVSQSIHTLGTLSTYGADCGSDVACKDLLLRQAAVAAENNAGQDFSQFDQIMIYHAGNGQESSGQGNDIWSVYFPGAFSVDGNQFDGFTVVPETEAGNVDPLGVICHEYGHQLGLPDLYDTSISGGASTVGSWDLMDYPYTAATGGALGSNPSHLSAWSKKFLGFLTPQTITISGVYSAFSVNVASQTFQIPVMVSGVGSSNEYFLFEYRHIQSTATYDKGIPSSGVLIWHIDETIASDSVHINNNDVNSPSLSGASHRGVELVEADFTQNYSGGSKGEPGDSFGNYDEFLPPLSDAFNGIPSGILATGISGIESALFQFDANIPAISTFTLASAVNFSTTVAFDNGSLIVSIPAGAFSDGTVFFVSGVSSNSFSALGTSSFAGQFNAGLTGCLLAAESNQQPVHPIQLTLDFSLNPSLSTLSSDEMTSLSVARYDISGKAWVPFLSQVDASNKKITASLNHLSLFQILKTILGPAVNQLKIFPNPLRPNLGAAYQIMNFSNLPPRSKIHIYTLNGEQVVQFNASDSGHAVWNGKDSSGHKAASGVYFAVVTDENGGQRKVAKVAVER